MKRVVLLRSNPVQPDPPVEKVAETLLENDLQVTILAWDRSQKKHIRLTEQFQNGSAEMVRFGIPAVYGGRWTTLVSIIRFEWKIFSWLIKNRKNYDAIHAFDLDTGLAASIVSRIFKKKLIYHVLDAYSHAHFYSDSLARRLVHKIEMKVITRADATLICTEARKEQIVGSEPKRLEIIHNSPDNTLLNLAEQFTLEPSTAQVKIAYVGTQCKGRGIEELLEAVKSDPRFELHMGGYGPLDYAIRKASEECDRIHYYGRLAYKQTLSLESQCDLMIAIYDPSISNHRYAAPNKLYESLMLGKPLLMCRDTGWNELLEKEGIGCLIEYSQEGIEQGLDELYKNKEKWSEISQKAVRLYNTMYSWEIMKERIRKIYSEII